MKQTKQNEKEIQSAWLHDILEIQSLAQAGLTYSKDPFDIERFERLQKISASMLERLADLPAGTILKMFEAQNGYQTPKLDTRAAIFKDNKILLVQENNGLWALPGGWCDFDQSVAENTIKECREEAGVRAEVEKVIAIQDRDKHNLPRYPWKVIKIFSLCKALSEDFQDNIETTASGYFSIDDLPALAENKTSKEQIELCFEAKDNPDWITKVD